MAQMPPREELKTHINRTFILPNSHSSRRRGFACCLSLSTNRSINLHKKKNKGTIRNGVETNRCLEGYTCWGNSRICESRYCNEGRRWCQDWSSSSCNDSGRRSCHVGFKTGTR